MLEIKQLNNVQKKCEAIVKLKMYFYEFFKCVLYASRVDSTSLVATSKITLISKEIKSVFVMT